MPLFVYGTLRQGEPAHALVEHARHLGTARTSPVFDLVDCGEYPALVRGGATAVVGELYEVDVETIAALDIYEGCPEVFTREVIELEGDLYCEAYLMPRSAALGTPRISSGDWKVRYSS